MVPHEGELQCAQPLPPKDPSLNLAEKAIDIIFHAALCSLVESKRHSKYLGLAMDYACYTHLRMATNNERGYKTPYEIIKGVRPNISHLLPFGIIMVAVIDKEGPKAHEQAYNGIAAACGKGLLCRFSGQPLEFDICSNH